MIIINSPSKPFTAPQAPNLFFTNSFSLYLFHSFICYNFIFI